MGFYAATCGITRTAIFEDDDVVVIVFNQPIKSFPLHRLRELTERQMNNYFSEESISRHLITYPEDSYSDYHPIHSIFLGQYNDAGWIKGNELDDENDEYRLTAQMFHLWAVEYLIGKPLAEIKEGIGIANEIYSRMYQLRISPLDTHTIGVQHDSAREMESQLKLHNKIGEWREKRLADALLEQAKWRKETDLE